MRRRTTQVFETGEATAQAAAKRVIELGHAAITSSGVFRLVLAGGSTPKRAYEILAEPQYRDALPWEKVHVYFGDERTVPPDHSQSNYRMAREAMLSKLPIPEAHVHRMEGEKDPEQAAATYESQLRAVFAGLDWPRLDLVLLGMGDDGHTASLFPGTKALDEKSAWVVANHVPQQETWRITLSAPAINHARHVLFLVTGASKADRLIEILPEGSPVKYPSQLIDPVDGTHEWYLDQAAVAKLKP